MTTLAGKYLVDVTERLRFGIDPSCIRAVAQCATGGSLVSRGPDGHVASNLTLSGTPFEASVSGGGGTVVPAIRYITETATQETEFGHRVNSQLDTIRELVDWLPHGNDETVRLLQSFVAALYPDPEQLKPSHRSATWIGVVHHIGAPQHIARLKVYGGPRTVPGVADRLQHAGFDFSELLTMPGSADGIEPQGIALEVDALGEMNYKVYFRIPHIDAAGPMLLIRHFGQPAREVLSELTRCGMDPARLHRHTYLVCRARSAGDNTFALYVTARRRDDFTDLARELAARHHGATHAVDALARAAETCDAAWSYSAVALGYSPEHGVDKLNVYCTPTWRSS